MIEIHRSDAAKMMRRVREHVALKLKDAAAAMQISSSLLSRKERGETDIDRKDIRNAIEVYNLAPWEAYELWLSAGFVPEKTLIPISRQEVYALATGILTDINYPAYISDAAGYILAWNRPYEETAHVERVLHQLGQSDSNGIPQVHMIDLLFSDHIRHCLGHEWETFAAQTMNRFYQQTLQIANDPCFPNLIDRLKKAYGDELIRQWNRAQTYVPPNEVIDADRHYITINHSSEIGEIKYLMVQTNFNYSPNVELCMQMPIGAVSEERYGGYTAKGQNDLI